MRKNWDIHLYKDRYGWYRARVNGVVRDAVYSNPVSVLYAVGLDINDSIARAIAQEYQTLATAEATGPTASPAESSERED